MDPRTPQLHYDEAVRARQDARKLHDDGGHKLATNELLFAIADANLSTAASLLAQAGPPLTAGHWATIRAALEHARREAHSLEFRDDCAEVLAVLDGPSILAGAIKAGQS